MRYQGKPWTDYSSKEQANIIYGKENICKLCNQPIVKVIDHSLPLKYFYYKTKSGKYTNEIIQVSYQSVLHPSGLCYYHLNKELGNFDIKKGGVYHSY